MGRKKPRDRKRKGTREKGKEGRERNGRGEEEGRKNEEERGEKEKKRRKVKEGLWEYGGNDGGRNRSKLCKINSDEYHLSDRRKETKKTKSTCKARKVVHIEDHPRKNE